MEARKCKRCGKKFAPKVDRQVFCCAECKNKAYYEKQRVPITRTCAECGEIFYPQRGQNAAKFCPKCANVRGRRSCPVCGTMIPEGKKARYCCEECKKEMKRRTRRARSEAAAEERKAAMKKERPKTSLEVLAAEATAHHMTYGKYVEWLEREERKA